MIKAFLDTNIYFSAILTPSGTSALLLELAMRDVYSLIVSEELVEELADVLNRPKAKKAFGKEYTSYELREYVSGFSDGFLNLGAVPRLNIDLDDPKDEHIVSAAIFGQADYLVSGDKKHILSLKDDPVMRKTGITVVSVGEFMDILKDEFLSE